MSDPECIAILRLMVEHVDQECEYDENDYCIEHDDVLPCRYELAHAHLAAHDNKDPAP